MKPNGIAAHIFYDDIGSGEAIITTHGVSENGSYWSLPGVSARLAERYRVIDTDMRAHGRTAVHGDPKGYDVETMADDIGALADHLGLDRFHLLTHATGGMVGLRYAMHLVPQPGMHICQTSDPLDRNPLYRLQNLSGGLPGRRAGLF